MKASTNIVIISTMEGYPWGGSEELWFGTALSLRRRQYNVTVSVKRWPVRSPKHSDLGHAGVRVIERPAAGGLGLRLHLAQLLYSAPILVLVSLGDNGMLGGADVLDYFRSRGVAYSVVCHNAAPWWWPPDGYIAKLRRCMVEARRVWFVSDQNRLQTEIVLGTALPTAERIWEPCMLRNEPCLPWPISEPARVACVAKLEPAIKGQDLLFQALNSNAWRHRNVVVSLYGEGRNRLALEALKARFQLHMVEFRGVKPPREIWQEEQLLILCSRTEGTPLALLEAMHCARPALVTAVGGNNELVIENETGFVAEAPTMESVSSALERAWEQRSSWQVMGQRAAGRIAEVVRQDACEILAEQIVHLSGSASPAVA
jgi:glycosyltransferase involved in cell wall biosynthesis